MKYIITALLSAALIWLVPHRPPINNSEPGTPHMHTAGQSESLLTRKSVVQAVKPKVVTYAVQSEEATQVVSTPPRLTSHEQLMNQAGINPKDYGAADYIISHESSWRISATEPHTGAYGLCQSLPAVKMASAGSDWQSNPVTQLKWCNSYALTRYGGWQGAYAHWTVFRWW